MKRAFLWLAGILSVMEQWCRKMGGLRTCSFPGCGLRHYSSGLCNAHKKQQQRGKELKALVPPDAPYPRRFAGYLKPGHLNPEEKRRIVQMRAEGQAWKLIASKFGMSRDGVRSVARSEERLRLRHMDEALKAHESEHGVITEEELVAVRKKWPEQHRSVVSFDMRDTSVMARLGRAGESKESP